ncbi:AbfB domain-containing protein [Nostoc favosum]|uniref:AbfB domain-containing protein n=1 Tax=Nostoc favosum CHAB5714 TaxID=2780399 RepID=A0ABS8IIJ5_9NOSO|nr:AbfB domain-containing protein [Nostoc favosum CHAB5714]
MNKGAIALVFTICKNIHNTRPVVPNKIFRLAPNDNTALFRDDATFCIKPGLASLTNVSFRSYNFPTYYIRHRNFELYIDPYSTNSSFLNDVTFTLVAPFAP